MSAIPEPLNLSPEVAELSTAEISDALDALGLPGSAFGIGHIAGPTRCFGPAFTVRYTPVDSANPGTVGDYLDDVPAGSVVALDNAGHKNCTVWGGILSQLAAHRHIGGTVINGACRDTTEADEANYPLYACGRFMRTGKDRVEVQAVGEPISLGDVRVAAGDYIVGDLDGIVVVPRGRALEVFERALALRAAEHRIVEATLRGTSLAQARQQTGYHTLQRSGS